MPEEPNGGHEPDLERLAAAGLYEPSSPSAAERRELLAYLLERFSVDEILQWVGRTNLVGVAARAIDRPPPLISAVEAASRAGTSVEVVTDLRAAFGFPVVDPEAPSVPATVVDDVETFLLGAELYGRDEALAFARVLGWAAARIMEAARALFGGSVERMYERAHTELETAQANELGIVAWMQAQSVMQHLLAEHPLRNVGFAEALLRGELHVAVGFVDLVSSTAWAESVSAADHSEALRRFEVGSSALAAGHDARLIKAIGDEVMLVADEPSALCRAAVEICAMASADPSLPDARGAVGYGLVTARDGDYFGPLVNGVARASKLAPAGRILVTSEVARFLDPTSWSTEPLGLQELRGVSEPVHLSLLTARG
ncbi:MAG: hypothetical protein JO291_11865 [Acidimicrobiia bacterium]|nr:hypothetical protein [Acidimicrobiia bacterium]